jgi:hypothetical protein
MTGFSDSRRPDKTRPDQTKESDSSITTSSWCASKGGDTQASPASCQQYSDPSASAPRSADGKKKQQTTKMFRDFPVSQDLRARATMEVRCACT